MGHGLQHEVFESAALIFTTLEYHELLTVSKPSITGKYKLILIYSLCQKKRTFNPEFFCGLPGGGGPKLHMVDYVNGNSTHAQFFPSRNLQPF